VKHIANKYLVLGNCESFYSYKNEVTLVRASLILDVQTFELRLNLVRFHIGGNDNGSKMYLPSYNVGTFFKPKKKLINSLLNEHQLRRRPFERWKTDYSKGCTLTELFTDMKTQDVFIMRAIKLIRIKKMLKKKQK
jgi:hypothetical protein